MNFRRVGFVLIAGGILALAAGCSSPRSKLPVYDTRQTGVPITQQKGRVVSVRDVLIKPATSAGRGGMGAGASIGAGVVTSVITGSTRAIGNAVGNVVGGGIGGLADEKMGEEITLELEGGRVLVIVQERPNGTPPLAPDEEVIVQTATASTSGGIYDRIYGGTAGGNTRVVRAEKFVDSSFASR